MILLEKSLYYKVLKPLNELKINNLFAVSVVNGNVEGKIYVDNEDNPLSFHIVHPYGMSLLFGETDNESFNRSIFDYSLNNNEMRNGDEWMQVYPNRWSLVLSDMWGQNRIKHGSCEYEKDKIIEHQRVNFKFNIEIYEAFKKRSIVDKFEIVLTDKDMYENFKGSVVPHHFWNSPEEFIEKSIGFTLKYESKNVAIAFASFIIDKKLELGMETIPECRGKGFALYTCAALIDYCLGNGYEPVWSCRDSNEPSLRLALKMGFEPELYIPYYKLCSY
ncbi:MAG: GNAT family N-acetyltransferase [Desulfobacterales bacterium]|nr:GNAT family N-acetyltransferase [Desulfobacterales bacterium]